MISANYLLAHTTQLCLPLNAQSVFYLKYNTLLPRVAYSTNHRFLRAGGKQLGLNSIVTAAERKAMYLSKSTAHCAQNPPESNVTRGVFA